MILKNYVAIWLLLTIFMGYESYLLNFRPQSSFTAKISQNMKSKNINLSPEPGKPISYYLGWIGMSIMLLTNLYILRKKWSLLSKIGTTKGWLDFHIFCGLVGPTFIIFHSNFKVRGLVAISFWSMMVSLISGIVGRYFYLQLSIQKMDFNKMANTWWEKFVRNYKRNKSEGSEDELQSLQQDLLSYFQLKIDDSAEVEISIIQAFSRALSMDVRFALGSTPALQGIPALQQMQLKEYLVLKRKYFLLEPFQRLMGYWHIFHLPFAIFMYLAAVIHIATALILGV